MSRSVKFSHYKQKLPYTALTQKIATELSISQQTVSAVLATYHKELRRQLVEEGNAVTIPHFATYHLRRRDYSEERRRKFAMGKATLPKYCYYPYACFAVDLRQYIADNKQSIATIIGEPTD